MTGRPWNRAEFDALKATWTQERINSDAYWLGQMFALAPRSPLLAEALGWAKAHDVAFFVDRGEGTSFGGYYTPGTGVVGIPLRVAMKKSPIWQTDVLTHEIRHAWQDWHGLIRWNGDDGAPGDFREFSVNNALIEADAYAFGRAAGGQFFSTRTDTAEKLMFHFNNWFGDPHRMQHYGGFFSRQFGVKWGIVDEEQPARGFEFVKPMTPLDGPSDNLRDVLPLGVSFSGAGNYLGKNKDFLLKTALRPALADTFWGVAEPEQQALTQALRKAALKRKYAPRP